MFIDLLTLVSLPRDRLGEALVLEKTWRKASKAREYGAFSTAFVWQSLPNRFEVLQIWT